MYKQVKALNNLFENQDITQTPEFKNIEKVLQQYFSNIKWNNKEKQFTGKTPVNRNDPWDTPDKLAEFNNKESFYKRNIANTASVPLIYGRSWDAEGNITIELRDENFFV